MSGLYSFLFSFFFIYYFKCWSQESGEEQNKEKRKEKENREDKTKKVTEMDAQVLLLMDPGAELGWAVLSDTLPSAGEKTKRKVNKQMGLMKLIN